MNIQWNKHLEPAAAVVLVLALLASALIAAICAGCTATETVIREYDAEGNLLKKTYASESLVKDITESTKNKTLVVWENGWAAYLSASTATTANAAAIIIPLIVQVLSPKDTAQKDKKHINSSKTPKNL